MAIAGCRAQSAWKCFEQKLWLNNQAAMRQISESHIICTQTIPGCDMERLNARPTDRVWDIDTGYDLMITEQQAVTNLLLKVAAV